MQAEPGSSVNAKPLVGYTGVRVDLVSAASGGRARSTRCPRGLWLRIWLPAASRGTAGRLKVYLSTTGAHHGEENALGMKLECTLLSKIYEKATRKSGWWHNSRKTKSVVFSIIKFYPSPKRHDQVIEILRSVRDLARPIPGCLGCWLSEEEFLPCHIRYAEQWESEEALNDHIRSDLYRRILAAMELSAQAPEVTVFYATRTRGFELIEALRAPPQTSKRLSVPQVR